MTSESGNGEGAAPEPAEVSPMADARAAMAQSRFSTPQGMVALAGWVLIGVWLIFGIFLADYFVGWTQLSMAIAAVFLFMGNRELFEKVAPVPVLMKLVGYLLALMGVVALIDDVRFPEDTLDEFPDVLGAILSYAGYALAFLGARSIKT